MKAHDVRSLVICKGCHDLGDQRHMIPTDLEWWHGRCYVEEFGEKRFLALPESHIAGLTLGDIGGKLARLWLDRHHKSVTP